MIVEDGYIPAYDGVRLFYQVAGEGPQTVVVANGTYLLDDLVTLAGSRRFVFFDLRNRGRSDASAHEGGILQDVQDMRIVAQQFEADAVDVMGHSFAGLLVALYAATYPAGTRRVVQLGPMSADPDRQFPPALSNRDATFDAVMAAVGALQPERENHAPEVFCEKVWEVLRALYVTNVADVGRIRWGRCDLPNERHAMTDFFGRVLPSIRRLQLSTTDVRRVAAPVLVVHGTKDRSAPYGAGREWALTLPNARLLSVRDAGHAPWIEAPQKVLPALDTFLRGHWPEAAEQVTELVPP
jgi:pimeloyl-ACP methyl ester carboxylesterase